MYTIQEVKTRKSRKAYIDFQNKLYADSPYYIPTLMADEMANLNPKKNPSYEYSECRQWLCYDGTVVVGRVAAIISNAGNKKWNQARIKFSRIDFIEDYDVFCLLIKTVEDWGRERGLTEIVGPVGFNDLDKEGMLVDGFDKIGMFITYYNHPYYPEFLERYGFRKDVDWLEHRIYTEYTGDKEKLAAVSEKIMKKYNLHFADISSRLKLKHYTPKLFDLLNEAYGRLYGVVPITEAMKKYYTGQFLLMVNLDYILMIEDEQGKIVCLGLMVPSFVEPMKKSNGRLFPFGWMSLLKAIRHPKVLDMYFVAASDNYRRAGLPLILINHLTQIAKDNGVILAETGPELETNIDVHGLWKGYKTEMNYRRRRCFIKEL